MSVALSAIAIIEAQVSEARDRMRVQAEAVSRLEGRSAAIRESVIAELRPDVDRASVPINRQLIELRRHQAAQCSARTSLSCT